MAMGDADWMREELGQLRTERDAAFRHTAQAAFADVAAASFRVEGGESPITPQSEGTDADESTRS